MDEKTLLEEKDHLDKTLVKINFAKTTMEDSMESMGAENLKKLAEMKADRETDPNDVLAFMDRMNSENAAFNFKDKFKRLEELGYLIKEPYFSRMDLEDTKAGVVEKFYVGKFGYTEDAPVVTDWRAKVASVYYRYRYPQKNVSYDTPDGLETRNLLLKRTYEIDNSVLIKYYNNDIQLDENEIITDKITQRTGGVLEDIVETIQVGQLDIIEADPRQICIVQGCVGSGKSTVAIHKLSHIFFNFPELIHPERSILIANNQILVGYLSTLFPKLGIFDIQYKTLRDVVYNFVFREELPIHIDFELPCDLHKFSVRDLDRLNEQILLLHDRYESHINELFEEKDFVGFAGFVYSRKYTVCENLNEVINDMEEELGLQLSNLKEYPDSVKAWLFKENIKSLRKLVSKLKKMRTQLIETELLELAKSLGLHINTATLDYYQTLVYIYLHTQIVGVTNFKKYEYCVVDEGQDLGVLEYLILGKVVMNGRFCILGDLNQSYQKEGLLSWDTISHVISEAKNAQTFELDTNYRSVKPVIDLANKILDPFTKNYLPKSINRRGAEPVFQNFSTQQEMLQTFQTDLSVDISKLDKSIGIICFGDDLFKESEHIISKMPLPKDTFVTLDAKTKITYIPKGVYLTRFEDCKGLEFAKVYILGLNLEKIDNFHDAKKAFVAVTRAMNELSIYSLK